MQMPGCAATSGVVISSARSAEALELDPSFDATVATTLEELSTEVPDAHQATVAWSQATVAPAVPWEVAHSCVTPGDASSGGGYRHLVKRRAREDGGYEFLFHGVAPVSALHWFAATSDLEVCYYSTTSAVVVVVQS